METHRNHHSAWGYGRQEPPNQVQVETKVEVWDLDLDLALPSFYLVTITFVTADGRAHDAEPAV